MRQQSSGGMVSAVSGWVFATTKTPSGHLHYRASRSQLDHRLTAMKNNALCVPTG